MAAPANLLTPKIEKLHWNDLTQLFELKITFELKTPLGNYPVEYHLTFNDLASAITAIVNIWSGVAPAIDGLGLTYPLGDLATLNLAVTGWIGHGFVEAIPTVGPGYTDLTGWTGADVPYDGGTGPTSFGQTV
jgi:hypothetical protein